MPGVVYKKKGGRVFPPDWTEIGYNDTPISTLIGFDYAVDIKENWDTSIVTHTERYRDDKVLMYFPKNIDTSNIVTADRMFQASNLEYIDIDLSNARTATAVFTDCTNLRGAIVHGLGNPEASSVLNNIANMFSNCRSLVDIDLNLTEYSTILSAVNLCTDCWKLKEFIYDGTTENIARISSLYNAFTNCYKLEKLTIKDTLPEWIGCYAAGSQTDEGCIFNIDIGSTASNGAQASFSKAKIYAVSDYPDKVSHISIHNISNAQSIFDEALFMNPEDTAYGYGGIDLTDHTNAINFSYAFRKVKCYANTFSAKCGKVLNANGMFDTFSFEDPARTKEISLKSSNNIVTDFSTCSNMQLAFANTNIKRINGLAEQDFGLVTNFTNMFQNSLDLDDNTLNDLLLALTTATTYAGTKTLATLGFTDSTVYPASRWQALSNYTAFTTAGWSIS